MVESMLRLAELDWAVPDFSRLSRRQKDLQVCIEVQKKQGCLHLLVDSTGIKMMGEGEWNVKKHDADYRRQWWKLHLGIDVQSLEIRAMEVTDNRTGDATTKMHCFKLLADRVKSRDFDRQVRSFRSV